MLKAKDIMSKKVNTINYRSNVVKASKIMAKTRRGYVIVLKNKKPIGILTDSDLIERVVSKNKNPSKIKVKDIMSSPLITITPNTDIVEISKKLRKNVIKRLPVLSKGKLVGIVSHVELAYVTPEFLNILEERLELKEAGEEPIRTEETTAGICESCGNYSENLKYVNGKWLCETCREEIGK